MGRAIVSYLVQTLLCVPLLALSLPGVWKAIENLLVGAKCANSPPWEQVALPHRSTWSLSNLTTAIYEFRAKEIVA